MIRPGKGKAYLIEWAEREEGGSHAHLQTRHTDKREEGHTLRMLYCIDKGYIIFI